MINTLQVEVDFCGENGSYSNFLNVNILIDLHKILKFIVFFLLLDRTLKKFP